MLPEAVTYQVAAQEGCKILAYKLAYNSGSTWFQLPPPKMPLARRNLQASDDRPSFPALFRTRNA
jgi:hypothetical protein